MTKRTCDGCSKCCEGVVNGVAHGYDFYPGKPCHFLGKGCTIYADRPVSPCHEYECAWLESDELPMWMRPDMCNVLVTRREKDGIEYFDIREAGKKLDAAVLSWFVIWALKGQRNILYQIDGGLNKIGSNEYLALQL